VTIVDASQRLAALNPQRSFCVGAPAGSGKTELLIQRYLTLLARVERPEQVLAITFTRKAAAEMRDRVMQALEEARLDQNCEGDHQRQTRVLALAALAADDRNNWQLIGNISRLNIKTIDSFCSQLIRQMPVLSEFGGQAEIVDNAEELYARAVVELFKLIESDNPLNNDLAAIMLHFDNNWSRLLELLTAMLARREQWGGYLGVRHQPEEAEAYLIKTVEEIVTAALTRLQGHLQPYSADILALQQYAAENRGIAVPEKFPQTDIADLSAWRDIRTLLLTASNPGSWRARVDVRMGFPAGKGIEQDFKKRFKEVIEVLETVDGLLTELNAVNSLPEIEERSESWQLVLHLSRILPRLAAELLLVFSREGKVDHCQIALSALQALGNDDLPTELALRLDYSLEHILVDEFQDTAINQYELVRRLTRGWGEHNESHPEQPRTLLIVGDGMQSIYGFRDANVGLFLQARSNGFNGVKLDYLPLQSNFRSDQGVVAWTNQTFSNAFPNIEDVSRGQISFTPATAVRPEGFDKPVAMRGFSGDAASQLEVEAICEEVQRGVADDNCQSLAILARTRGHLQPILERLRELHIDYSAQDIDSLASSSVIMDLLSLVRALLNPADRVAWLAILRAPWCGLTLDDLHVIGNAGEPSAYEPVADTLENTRVLEQLSDDGRARAVHLSVAMARARSNRDRLALRNWIEELWLHLGGAATVPADSALRDAERFFQLLEQAEGEDGGLSIDWLLRELNKLYVQSEHPSSKVQVMTLHKAKGLEFDWVIIPGLQKTTRVNARPLLLWDDHSSASGERAFLLAADDHSAEGEATLYNWLKAQRSAKETLETTRLLYVGATRAVQRLFLTACVKYDERKDSYKEPPGRSLLASIWTDFCEQMLVKESPELTEAANEPSPQRLLHRLDQKAIEQLSTAGGERFSGGESGANIPLRIDNRLERYVGTVVHLALEQLSRLSDTPDVISEAHLKRWRFALAALGLHGQLLEEAIRRVEHSVTTVLGDDVGRWMLSPDHQQAESELSLTLADESGQLTDIIIDRTFIERKTNKRWLIDYKNSQPEPGEALEVFSDREADKYREQLALYRSALEKLGDEPVVCALYFTSVARLHAVDA